jgi:PAS domain S-box-containing protein
MPLPPSAPSRAEVAAGKKTGTFEFLAASDGIERIYSFHKLDSYPFYVTIGFAREDVLAGWKARSLAVALLGLLLLLLMSSLLYRLVHAEARRAQATTALAQTEEQLKLIVDASMDAVIGMAGDGRINEWSAGAERMFGHARIEAMGKVMSDLIIPPALRGAHSRGLKRFLQTGEGPMIGRRLETTALRADGSEFPVELSIALVRRDGDHVFSAFARDITGRKRAEESSKTHSLVLHSMAEAVNYTDAQGIVRFTNPAFDKIFGYEPGELIGLPVSVMNALSPEENARLVASILEAIRKVGTWEGEFINRRKDGTTFYTQSRITKMQHAGETWAVTVQEDITARKNAEDMLLRLNAELEMRVAERTQAFQESEERFSKLAAAIEEVFWMADTEIQSMVYVSPGYERIWGRSRQSLYDNPRSFIEAIHPQDRERVVADLDARKIAHRPFDQEYRIIRPDGSVRWIWDRGFPIESKSKPISLYAGLAADITERKRAEDRQRASEDRAHELLRQLIEAQEGERRRIAADLHDVVGQNLSALEIEFQRLRGVAPAGAAGAMLDNMARIIQDATNSVRDAISDLHPAVLDDYGVLVAIKGYVSRIERLTGLRISVVGDALEPRLPRKTELAIFRVVQEALMNTAKHAAASRVTVEFTRAGDILRLRVEDDGKGIVGATPDQERAGGWGIEFMRERTEALGGVLRVESPGVGTRIIMEIPLGHSNHPG